MFICDFTSSIGVDLNYSLMRSLTGLRVMELMLSHTSKHMVLGMKEEIYINNNAASSNKYNKIYIYTMSK
jgi:hypothetical protein